MEAKMTPTENILAAHPQIGFIASIIGAITPFISAILPVFQLCLVLASLVVALLTIEAQLKKRKIDDKNDSK